MVTRARRAPCDGATTKPYAGPLAARLSDSYCEMFGSALRSFCALPTRSSVSWGPVSIDAAACGDTALRYDICARRLACIALCRSAGGDPASER